MTIKHELLLEVKDLRIQIKTICGTITLVDRVNFSINRGEVLALVGESGCGKSMTSLSLLRLLPRNAIIDGSIIFDGVDIVRASKSRIRGIRGSEISMIFQEPMTSLNPVLRVGDQIIEAILTHVKITRKAAYELTLALLNKVGIPDPPSKANQFPHQMSGGQRQRVMIAMALACKPKLLIADEPTTALDVTIQAQILDLMRELKNEFGTSMLFISHDLGVVSEIADRIAVMYAGKIVELSTAKKLFSQPVHPYTKGLFKSIPDGKRRGERLDTISGSVPSPGNIPPGCSFYPRCPDAMSTCMEQDPKSIDVETKVACLMNEENSKHMLINHGGK